MAARGFDLSPGLNAEIEKAKAVYINIGNSFPEYFPIQSGHRQRCLLLAASVHLGHDLNASIVRLISRGGTCDGGAFALLRPLVETCVKGLWMYCCATDAVIERTCLGESVAPPLSNMIDAVDKKIGQAILGQIRGHIKDLHGYTHCGVEQLVRRFDNPGRLAPNYTEEEKSLLLKRAAWTMSVFGHFFCKVAEGPDSPAAKRIYEKFKETYQSA